MISKCFFVGRLVILGQLFFLPSSLYRNLRDMQNYTRNVLLAEDKKKYNAQNKGIFAKFVYVLIIDGFGAGLGL
jgi:hypothetical protein